MTDNVASVTLDELLQFIADYVVEQYRTRGSRTDGATLADAIRDHFPGFQYEQVGLERLGRAISQAETKGLIVRHRDVEHLEVSPGPATGIDVVIDAVQPAERTVRFLRPDVWRAFVFVVGSEQRYFDRRTGRLRPVSANDTETIARYDSDPQFVPMPTIPTERQQSWMRNFVESKEALNIAEAPIEDEAWWVNFPLWLKRKDPWLERSWRRDRTRRVMEHATDWAMKNDVPLKALVPLPTQVASQASRLSTAAEIDMIRRAVIAAVREMSRHELESLAIPLRYILRHFQVR